MQLSWRTAPFDDEHRGGDPALESGLDYVSTQFETDTQRRFVAGLVWLAGLTSASTALLFFLIPGVLSDVAVAGKVVTGLMLAFTPAIILLAYLDLLPGAKPRREEDGSFGIDQPRVRRSEADISQSDPLSLDASGEEKVAWSSVLKTLDPAAVVADDDVKKGASRRERPMKADRPVEAIARELEAPASVAIPHQYGAPVHPAVNHQTQLFLAKFLVPLIWSVGSFFLSVLLLHALASAGYASPAEQVRLLVVAAILCGVTIPGLGAFGYLPGTFVGVSNEALLDYRRAIAPDLKAHRVSAVIFKPSFLRIGAVLVMVEVLLISSVFIVLNLEGTQAQALISNLLVWGTAISVCLVVLAVLGRMFLKLWRRRMVFAVSERGISCTQGALSSVSFVPWRAIQGLEMTQNGNALRVEIADQYRDLLLAGHQLFTPSEKRDPDVIRADAIIPLGFSSAERYKISEAIERHVPDTVKFNPLNMALPIDQ